ncbi:MAG: T9SS type A sorting domain-containing protein [Bacteroidales bacterium]|nr:T9SS type A sorting domain-containing protein [Bacteroidales bacterium]
MYNSIGQKISEGNYNINEGINVKSFAKGIYWVKIFLKEKFYLTNFVKE